MASSALATLPNLGGASTCRNLGSSERSVSRVALCRLRCPRRCQKSAMPSFQIRVAAAILSATISAPIFAQEVQAKMLRDSISSKGLFFAADRTKIDGYCWCLHNYSADTIDCSYNNRKQRLRLEGLANACSTHHLADVLCPRGRQ